MWFAIVTVAALLLLMAVSQVSRCREYDAEVAGSQYRSHREGLSVQETLRAVRRREIEEHAARERQVHAAVRRLAVAPAWGDLALVAA